MITRTQGMANRFEAASCQVSNRIEQCNDLELRAHCAAEACTVAALASHVARVHELTISWIAAMLAGESLAGLTMADIDQANQEWFANDADRRKDDVLAMLDANRQDAVTFVRQLADGDLDHSAAFGPFNGAVISVQTLIEQVLIGDPLNHLRSIDSALANVAD